MNSAEIANFTPEQIQTLNDAAAALQAVADAAQQEKSVTIQMEAFNLQLARLQQILSITEDRDAYAAILAQNRFSVLDEKGKSHSHTLHLAALLQSNDEQLSSVKSLLNELKAQRVTALKRVYESIDAAIANVPLPVGDKPYSDYFLGIDGAKKTDEDITPTLDELSRTGQFPAEGLQDKDDGQTKRAEHPLITRYAKSYAELESALKMLGESNTLMDILYLMGADFKLSALEKHYLRCAERTSPIMGSILTGTARILAMKKETEQGDKSLKDKLLASKTSTEFLAIIVESSVEEKAEFNASQRLHVMEELIKRPNKIEEMQILLDNNLYDVNYQHRVTKRTALHCAIEHNNRDAILFLVEKNADIFSKNKSGEALLTLAFEKDPTVLLNTVLYGLAKRFNAKNNMKARLEIEALREQVNHGAINKDNVEIKFKELIGRLELGLNKKRRSNSLDNLGWFHNKPQQFSSSKRTRSVSAENQILPQRAELTPEQIQSKLILLTRERINSIHFSTEDGLAILSKEKDLERKMDRFNRYNEALSILEGNNFYNAKFKTRGSSLIHDTAYVTNMEQSPKDMKVVDRLNLASALINEKEDEAAEQQPKKQSKIVSRTKELFWKTVEFILGKKLEDRFPKMLTSKDTLFRESFNELWARAEIRNRTQPEASGLSQKERIGIDRRMEAVAATKYGIFATPHISMPPTPRPLEIPGIKPGSAA